MATKGDIKKAILRVAGDPVSGAIAALADEMADAVVALDNSSAETPTKVKPARGTVQQAEKETRVMEAVEQR
jgi:hypothetical protein|tara:strand:- start:145 stop:360 length:216 start_codon:yes stop_codon:yes gene_type:complete